jgi:hypothetical protein
MARALRPVVVLMFLATILFILDGILDHNAAPSQPILDEYNGVGWTSFVFAIANLLLTIAVARGSERTLLGRIALSAFFIVERPLTAFVLGPKPIESIVVHFVTAFVELIILIGALRVWRLGHSVIPAEMDAILALDGAGPGAVAAAPAAPMAAPAAPLASTVAAGSGSAALIGVLTLVLAAALVADGVAAGYFPGGRDWGTAVDSGWLVYLFAIVILTVATRAVHGGRVALRVLLALSLIMFIERGFSPFVTKIVDPTQLGLHGLAAFDALALALATARAIARVTAATAP